ncbi:unnamed protein product [Symbiodinium pilosum]|uniref:Uncharacterized protein n=1 Tax=Symbiodinium pilosum TaxID=2952 RepID=A0A812TFI1_SYMPI|nr:unnamed protein product [Symbiodinium pilosum]
MRGVLQSTQETLNKRRRRRIAEKEAFAEAVSRRRDCKRKTEIAWDLKLREVALLAFQVPEGSQSLRNLRESLPRPDRGEKRTRKG